MSYLGNEPPQLAGYSTQTKAAPVGSSIALDQEGTINSTLLFLDGVRQTPTTDYTISGTTLTLTSTAPTAAVATILFLGDVTDIGQPSNDTVDVDQLNTTSAGTTGQFLKKTGAATIDWATVDALPSQTGNSGKFLTTSGSAASWDVIDTAGIEDDIALLGFKVAINGSWSKYNLVDQTEDAFYDETGIDAALSTGEAWNSGYYYSGAPSVVQTYTELVATAVITAGMLSQSGLSSFNAANLINGAIVAPAYGFYTDASGVGSWCQLDFGSGNQYSIRRWGWYMGAGGNVYAEWKVQHSDDTVTWTDWNSGATFGGHPATPAWYYSGTPANVAGMRHRYWRTYKTDAAVSGHFHMELLFDAYDDGPFSNMVLVSNATTAETTATKGDIVMTYTNGVAGAGGIAAINTDVKAYCSRDNGATYTLMTLVAQGTTGTASPNFIVSAHDVDISSQPSGTEMRYKIETLNQSAAKETRIQAVSLGWS